MIRFRASAVWLAVCIFVGGCTTPQTGVIAGRWTPPGKAPEPVPIAWESDSSTQGRMFITLGKGGERFQGTYVRVTSGTKLETVQPILTDWGPLWDGYNWGSEVDPWWWGPEGGMPVGGYTNVDYYPVFVRQYSGKVVATLFGNEGHSMRCRFTLVRPQEGLMGGGVGACESSKGAKISARF